MSATSGKKGPHSASTPLIHLKKGWKDYQISQGLKQTQQRDLIVDTFFRCHHHISLDELLEKVRRKNTKIGYVTVYRTLKLLLHAKLAEARQFGDGQTRYEAANPALPHHDHLICLRCGLILEFENDEIEILQNRMAEKLGGFTIAHHKLELYGLCPKARGIEKGNCPAEKDRSASKSIP